MRTTREQYGLPVAVLSQMKAIRTREDLTVLTGRMEILPDISIIPQVLTVWLQIRSRLCLKTVRGIFGLALRVMAYTLWTGRKERLRIIIMIQHILKN